MKNWGFIFTKNWGFILIIIFLSACTSGQNPYRLIYNHQICGSDSEGLVKLDENQSYEFYKILAPLADMDKASLQAPHTDDEKIKRPDVQDKMVKDLRERCLFEEQGELGPDYENQTFKFRQKSVHGGKKPDLHCPIEISESVLTDKQIPALIEKAKPIRSIKGFVEVHWKKKDPNYTLLGFISDLELKGEAETLWYKKTDTIEKSDPEMMNVLLTVNEKYDLVATLDNNEKILGHYKTCRKLQEDIVSGKAGARKARYEFTVVRMGLKTNKKDFNSVNEGKFITVVKQRYDDKLQKWVTDRSLRNDFYINGVLLTSAEIAALENKRRNEIGFKP